MIRAGRRTPAALALVLVVLPIVEIWLLVEIGQRVGLLPVLGLVVAEALVGSWLIRRRWRSAWQSVQQAARGVEPAGPDRTLSDALDTAVVVAGGIALIFPGLITDLLAVICLLPFTRRLPRRLITRWLDRRLDGLGRNLGFPARRGPAGAGPSGEVIEGEVVEDPRRSQPGRDEPVVIRGEIDDR
jgi:UPF0716 protein FxsA